MVRWQPLGQLDDMLRDGLGFLPLVAKGFEDNTGAGVLAGFAAGGLVGVERWQAKNGSRLTPAESSLGKDERTAHCSSRRGFSPSESWR